MVSNTNKSQLRSNMILGDYDNKSAIEIEYVVSYVLLNISIRKYE